MTTATMTARDARELLQSRESDAYATWERETAKVEKAMQYGIISEAEGTRKLIALDARLDAALERLTPASGAWPVGRSWDVPKAIRRVLVSTRCMSHLGHWIAPPNWSSAMAAKTVPTLTRSELLKSKLLTLELRDAQGNVVYKGHMPVREFSTNSVGYNTNAKSDLCIDGEHYVGIQIGANITVIGSKDLPKA